MQLLINQIILTMGAWQATGHTDNDLERQLDIYFDGLKKAAQTDRDGAIALIQKSLRGEENIIPKT